MHPYTRQVLNMHVEMMKANFWVENLRMGTGKKLVRPYKKGAAFREVALTSRIKKTSITSIRGWSSAEWHITR